MASFAPAAAAAALRSAVKGAIKSLIPAATSKEVGVFSAIVCRQYLHVKNGNPLQNNRPLKCGVTVGQIMAMAKK